MDLEVEAEIVEHVREEAVRVRGDEVDLVRAAELADARDLVLGGRIRDQHDLRHGVISSITERRGDERQTLKFLSTSLVSGPVYTFRSTRGFSSASLALEASARFCPT